MKKYDINKVVIIGTGFVGSATAFALMQSNLITEMVLIDIDREKAEGEAMDLNHGVSFVSPMEIRVGDYADCRGADLIIISAGPSMGKGESRLDLAGKNSKVIRSIMEQIMKYTRDAILLIATNPVDILTYIAADSFDYDRKKVIGSGTVLDSSRFRYLLSRHCDLDARNIHGYIIGEHGDSEVAAWSLTNIAGVRIDKYPLICENYSFDEKKSEIFKEVRDAGYEIIRRKGFTCYGIALSIKRIAEAILRDENSVLTVSSVLEGQYGISDVALSVPTIVNRDGIREIIELPLEERELKLLHESANELKKIINDTMAFH